MTNREWLESLNDTQLAAWFCDELEIGEMYGMTIYTGVNTEKKKYNSSYKGILQWLNEDYIDFYKELNEKGI